MARKDRSQFIVIRDGMLLMARHCQNGDELWCLPGGAVEGGETPEEAALRELKEECCAIGTIIKKTSEYTDPFNNGMNHTFFIDIGNQDPVLGEDPETKVNPILFGIAWRALDEICERDRAYIWSAGLAAVKEFADELTSWGDDISYHGKHIIQV